MIRDIPGNIASTLHFILDQAPDIVICSGGLGPRTTTSRLSALAQALDLPLMLNEAAAELVETHYKHLIDQHYLPHRGPEAARRKMATLPEGANPLHNSVGTAPGVSIEYDGTLIYVLPGVPAELEAIFDEEIAPELVQRFASSEVGRTIVACPL